MKDVTVNNQTIQDFFEELVKEVDEHSNVICNSQPANVGKWGMARLWRAWMATTAQFMAQNGVTQPLYIDSNGKAQLFMAKWNDKFAREQIAKAPYRDNLQGNLNIHFTPTISEPELQEKLTYIASDELEGRSFGRRMRRLGLAGVGIDPMARLSPRSRARRAGGRSCRSGQTLVFAARKALRYDSLVRDRGGAGA